MPVPSFSSTPKAVIFDLDGTLADTAPDLVAALNVMRKQRNLKPMDVSELTADELANGSRSMMRAHLLEPDEDVEQWRPEFFKQYDAIAHQHTTLFDGMHELLDCLDDKKIPWAIVTNKPEQQTFDLLPIIKLDKRVAMVVCGDTFPKPKPDPTGLLAVCSKLNLEPQDCIFLGDAIIDEQAAVACNMHFVAAGWGLWRGQTKWVCNHPDEIAKIFA